MFKVKSPPYSVSIATTPTAITGMSGLNRFTTSGTLPTQSASNGESFTAINSPSSTPGRRASRSDTG